MHDVVGVGPAVRTVKPREVGLTIIIDKGLGVGAFRDLLEVGGGFIDYVKLGFGTAALYPPEVLRKKIKLAKMFQVSVFLGGTFFEIAWYQGRYDWYLDVVRALGLEHLEISDGTIELDPGDRRAAMEKALKLGLTVFSEVGKKDSREDIPPGSVVDQVKFDLETGASKVILEGRDSGEAGILYASGGRIREEVWSLVIEKCDPRQLIWEAPKKKQQEELIRRLGSNVSLGNIPPEEILSLEALRRGLRSDTLKLYLESARGRM